MEENKELMVQDEETEELNDGYYYDYEDDSSSSGFGLLALAAAAIGGGLAAHFGPKIVKKIRDRKKKPAVSVEVDPNQVTIDEISQEEANEKE